MLGCQVVNTPLLLTVHPAGLTPDTPSLSPPLTSRLDQSLDTLDGLNTHTHTHTHTQLNYINCYICGLINATGNEHRLIKYLLSINYSSSMKLKR